MAYWVWLVAVVRGCCSGRGSGRRWRIAAVVVCPVVVLAVVPGGAGIGSVASVGAVTVSQTGDYVAVAPVRVLDTRSGLGSVRGPLAAGQNLAVQVAGVGGVPTSGVAAVVLNVTVTAPTAPGWVSAYADGSAAPAVSNLNFLTGQTVPNLVVARLGADGKISLHNGSPGTVHLIADISGYYLGSPAASVQPAQTSPPPVSTSRYIRDLTGSSTDAAVMYRDGAADAAANPSGQRYLMLLDIGGQDQADGGVILSATSQFLSYSQLLSALDSYLDGYAAAQNADATATVVIGTNNDIDVSAATGADWATRVVTPAAAHAATFPNLSVGGADDMEPGFSATDTETRDWLTGYLNATSSPFVFNGSADGCSTTAANSSCNHGWTARDLQWLAGGAASTRILSLPQIYYSSMAQQWKYISLTGVNAGRPPLAFAGPLTEYTACQQAGGCSSLTGNQAWNALWTQLQSDPRLVPPGLPYSTDLRIN